MDILSHFTVFTTASTVMMLCGVVLAGLIISTFARITFHKVLNATLLAGEDIFERKSMFYEPVFEVLFFVLVTILAYVVPTTIFICMDSSVEDILLRTVVIASSFIGGLLVNAIVYVCIWLDEVKLAFPERDELQFLKKRKSKEDANMVS